jgi:hypothetical protein
MLKIMKHSKHLVTVDLGLVWALDWQTKVFGLDVSES